MEDKKVFKHISSKLSGNIEKPLELRGDNGESKASTYTNARNINSTTAIYESADIIIGEKVTITGEITEAQRVTVAGTANITALNLEHLKVTGTGKVKGNIISIDCDIEGIFEGQMEVKGTLRLKNTAEAIGDITCKNLIIEKGAKLSGKIATFSDDVS